jgi:hypothetical protein
LGLARRRIGSSVDDRDDWLHWQQSPAAFSLVDFGFSPFQLLIFDQQQIALASQFIASVRPPHGESHRTLRLSNAAESSWFVGIPTSSREI